MNEIQTLEDQIRNESPSVKTKSTLLPDQVVVEKLTNGRSLVRFNGYKLAKKLNLLVRGGWVDIHIEPDTISSLWKVTGVVATPDLDSLSIRD